MKTINWLLALLLSLSTISFSQTGWYIQNVNSTNHLHSICFPSANTGYIAGWGSELIKTTDGGNNWFHLYCNITIDIQCVYFINNDIGWIVGGAGMIGNTTNGGLNWVSQSGGSTNILTSTQFLNITTGFIVGYTGKILKTTNAGAIWNIIQSSTSYNLTSILFLNDLTGWITGDHGTILKTINSGDNWFTQNPGVSNNLGRVFCINSTTGWVSGDNGIILKTTSGGNSWNLQQSGTTNWIMGSFFVSQNTGWIVGVSGTILKTTNGGDNWFSQISNTTNDFRCNYFLNANTGFTVGFNGTVVKTKTGGSILPAAPILVYPPNQSTNIPLTPAMTWNIVTGAINYKIQISTISNFNVITDSSTTTLTQYPVPSGKLQHGLTYFWRVYANTDLGATLWSEVWYFSTQTIGIKYISSSVPAEFKLYSNYPNPFNPATKIKFDIPKSTLTKLIVYDALGRTIETLVNKELSAGTYEYTWNASKYNSGIYFIRIVSDKYIETRKMVLLK
jgi:photosystem II stability/assembly factor-like uncharacterized protein